MMNYAMVMKLQTIVLKDMQELFANLAILMHYFGRKVMDGQMESNV